METVAAHAVFLVCFVWERIHIGVVRHCLVECSVEYAYLRHFRQNLADSFHAGYVYRIVERSEVVAFLYFCNHLIGDKHALVEFFASVYKTVAYGVDFIEMLDATVFLACKVVKYYMYGNFMVWH